MTTLMRKKNLAWNTVNDHVFILRINSFEKTLFEFNELGSFIWNQFDGTKQDTEIVDRIKESFDVGSEQAKNDFIEFKNQLVEKDLLC